MNRADVVTYLFDTARSLDEPYHLVCIPAISDDRFLDGFGSANKHHNYAGGLSVHTVEVLKLLQDKLKAVGIDRNVLLTAAIWHDYAKAFEYVQGPEKIERTRYYKCIHHLAGSYAFFLKEVARLEVLGLGKIPEDKVEEIGHCILSHHGRYEWGSPVEPQTPEAFLLHSADMLSAKAAEFSA